MTRTNLNLYTIKNGDTLLDTTNQLRECPCPNCSTHIKGYYMKQGKERWFNCPKCNSYFKTEPMLRVTEIF